MSDIIHDLVAKLVTTKLQKSKEDLQKYLGAEADIAFDDIKKMRIAAILSATIGAYRSIIDATGDELNWDALSLATELMIYRDAAIQDSKTSKKRASRRPSKPKKNPADNQTEIYSAANPDPSHDVNFEVNDVIFSSENQENSTPIGGNWNE